MTSFEIKAIRKQSEYKSRYGRIQWDIEKEDLFFLNKQIGFTVFGPPKSKNTGESYYVGYNEDELNVIQKLADQIIAVSDCYIIELGFVILVTSSNELPQTIVFRIRNKTGNIFVDINGRVYSSWESFKTDNTLDECVYCAPKNGIYTCDSYDILKSPACNFFNKLLQYTDIITTVAAVGGTLASIFVKLPELFPFLTGVTGYNILRSGEALLDRLKHKQSISLFNSKSRSCWLNIVNSSLGLGTAAVLHKAKHGLFNSRLITTIERHTILGLQTTSVIFSGFGFIENVFKCVEKNDTNIISFVDMFQLSCGLLFFGNTLNRTRVFNQLSTYGQAGIVVKSYVKKVLQKVRINTNLNENSRMMMFYCAPITSLSPMVLENLESKIYYIIYQIWKFVYDVPCWICIQIKNLFNSPHRITIGIKSLIYNILEYTIECILSLRILTFFHHLLRYRLLEFVFYIYNLAKGIKLIPSFTKKIILAIAHFMTGKKYLKYNEEKAILSQKSCLLDKVAEIMPDLKHEDIKQVQDFTKKVETIVIEEFVKQVNAYTRQLKAVNKAKLFFNINKYNKSLGISGDVHSYFFNKALDTVNDLKKALKLKEILMTKVNAEFEHNNILNEHGKLYTFEVSNLPNRFKMNSEIVKTITKARNVKCLENSLKLLSEKDEMYILLIRPTNCLKKHNHLFFIWYSFLDDGAARVFYTVHNM